MKTISGAELLALPEHEPFRRYQVVTNQQTGETTQVPVQVRWLTQSDVFYAGGWKVFTDQDGKMWRERLFA